MRLFTLFLMMSVAVFGLNIGSKAITGRDLVTLPWPAQSSVEPRPTPSSAPKAAALPTPEPVAPTAETQSSAPFEPWWVQNHMETDLWSGPEGGAASLEKVPQWSYFQVIEPQNGPRLHVRSHPAERDGYVDAAAVGPSSAPNVLAAAEIQARKVVGNTDGLGVYVRRSPRAQDRIRAWPEGTSMEVVEEGIEGEGRRWTKVKSPDGQEGFVPDEYLVTR